MLLLVLWKMPTIWKNKRLIRDKAWVTLCFFYTGGFVLAFSAILNLGILARQRVQVLPFFLALIVALAWDEPKDEDGSAAARLERLAPRRPPQRAPNEPSVAASTPTPAVVQDSGRHQRSSD
jgi:hypothetical protein